MRQTAAPAFDPPASTPLAVDVPVFPASASPTIELEAPARGYGAVLANRAFARLWTAQICAQLAQNTVFASMLAQIQLLTGSSTNVVFVIASGLLPQVVLSSFAGVLVDRRAPRAVLVASNVLRVCCVLGYLSFQATPWVLYAMIFGTAAIGQFFAPAEAAAIPILVQRRDLMAATSLFNMSFTLAQVIPFGLGLLLLSFIGLTHLLLLVIALFALAALLTSTLPARVAARPPRRADAPSIREAAGRIEHELADGLRFVARDGALRLALLQINITPTVLFLFGVLGVGYVQRVIHLRPDNLYVLLVPAGIGLLGGTWALGQFGHGVPRSHLIHWGIFALGAAVVAMGILPPFIHGFRDATHVIPLRPYQALTYPAMAIALIVGAAMALTTVPTQTIIFERAAPEMRGRVLAMQQWLGGAVPLLPLLVVGPLTDALGVATLLTGLGVVIVLAGWYSVQADARRRLASRARVAPSGPRSTQRTPAKTLSLDPDTEVAQSG